LTAGPARLCRSDALAPRDAKRAGIASADLPRPAPRPRSCRLNHPLSTPKKNLKVRIVSHAFEIVHLLTDQNPIQVLVDAIINRWGGVGGAVRFKGAVARWRVRERC
jgi:hypothetical protein